MQPTPDADEPAEPVNLADFEALAGRRMPRGAFDYYAGGAEDETTLRGNREAFSELYLRPRMLAGLGEIDTSTSVLGLPVSLPALVTSGLPSFGIPPKKRTLRAGERR